MTNTRNTTNIRNTNKGINERVYELVQLKRVRTIRVLRGADTKKIDRIIRQRECAALELLGGTNRE